MLLTCAAAILLCALFWGALGRPRRSKESVWEVLAVWGGRGGRWLLFLPAALVFGVLAGSPEHNEDIVRASLRGVLIPHQAGRVTFGGDAERDTFVDLRLPPGALEFLLDKDRPDVFSLRVTDPRLGLRLTETSSQEKYTNQRQLFDGAVLLFRFERLPQRSASTAVAESAVEVFDLDDVDPAGCTGKALAVRLSIGGRSVFRELHIDAGRSSGSPPRIPRLAEGSEGAEWGVPRYGNHSGMRLADVARWLDETVSPPPGCRLPPVDEGHFVGLIYKRQDRNPSRHNRFFLHHVDRNLELCGDPSTGRRCALSTGELVSTGEIVELAEIPSANRRRARSNWQDIPLPQGNVIELDVFPMRSSWGVEGEGTDERLAGRQRLYFPDGATRSFELRLVSDADALHPGAPTDRRRPFPALRVDFEHRRQQHTAVRLFCPGDDVDARIFPHCIFDEADEADSGARSLRFALTAGVLPHGLLEAPAPVVKLPMPELGARSPWAYIDLLPESSDRIFLLSESDLEPRAIAFGELFTVGYGVRPVLTLQRLRAPYFLFWATLVPCLVLALLLPRDMARSLAAILLLCVPLCLLAFRMLLSYRLFALAPSEPVALPRSIFTMLMLPSATLLVFLAGRIVRRGGLWDRAEVAESFKILTAATVLAWAARLLLADMPIDVQGPRVAGFADKAAQGYATLVVLGLAYVLLGRMPSRWPWRALRRLLGFGQALAGGLRRSAAALANSLDRNPRVFQALLLLLPVILLGAVILFLSGPQSALRGPAIIGLGTYPLFLLLAAFVVYLFRRRWDSRMVRHSGWFLFAVVLVVAVRVSLAEVLGRREALYFGSERFGLSVVFTPLCVLLAAALAWLTADGMRRAREETLVRVHLLTVGLWALFIGLLSAAAFLVKDYGIILVNLVALLLIVAPCYQVGGLYPGRGARQVTLRLLMASLLLPAVVLILLPVSVTGGVLGAAMQGFFGARETALVRPALQRSFARGDWRTAPGQTVADLPAEGLRQTCPCKRESGGQLASQPPLFSSPPDYSVYWGQRDMVFRMLRASRPDDLDQIATQSADREAAAFLKARAYALGADGRSSAAGYLGSDIIDPPGGLLDSMLNDDVVSLLLLPELGLPGLLVLTSLLMTLFTLAFWDPDPQARHGRHSQHRLPRLVWALALGVFSWQGLYMIGVTMNLVPFTGKNVPLLNARSLSDFLESSALLLLAALALATSRNFPESGEPRTTHVSREAWSSRLRTGVLVLVGVGLALHAVGRFLALPAVERGNIPRSGLMRELAGFQQDSDQGWELGLALDCTASPLQAEYIGSDILAMLEVEKEVCGGSQDPRLWQIVPHLHPLAIRRALGISTISDAETLKGEMSALWRRYREARNTGAEEDAGATSDDAVRLLRERCPRRPPLSDEQIRQLRNLHCFYTANRYEMWRIFRDPERVFEWGPRRQRAGTSESVVDPGNACALVDVKRYALREHLVSRSPPQWEGEVGVRLADRAPLKLRSPDGRYVPLPTLDLADSGEGQLSMPWWELRHGAPVSVGIWNPDSKSDDPTEVMRVTALGSRVMISFEENRDFFQGRVDGRKQGSTRKLALLPGDLLTLTAAGVTRELAVTRVSETRPVVARTRVNGRSSRVRSAETPALLKPMTEALDRIVQDPRPAPQPRPSVTLTRDPNLGHALDQKLRSWYEELQYFNRFDFDQRLRRGQSKEAAFAEAEGCLRTRLPRCRGRSAELSDGCQDDLRKLWTRCYPTEAAVTFADTASGDVLAAASAPDQEQVDRTIRHFSALKDALADEGQGEIASTILIWRMGLLNQMRSRFVADHNFDRHMVGSVFKPFAASIMLTVAPELEFFQVENHPRVSRSPSRPPPKCVPGREVATRPLQGIGLLRLYEDGLHNSPDGWVDLKEFVEWSCNDFVMRLGLLALRVPPVNGDLTEFVCAHPGAAELAGFRRSPETMRNLGLYRSRLAAPGQKARFCAEQLWHLDPRYRQETILASRSCQPTDALRNRGILYAAAQVKLKGLEANPFFQRLDHFGMYNGTLSGPERYDYGLWRDLFASKSEHTERIDDLLREYFGVPALSPEKPASLSDRLKALDTEYLLFWRGSGNNRWSNVALIRALHKLLYGPQGRVGFLAAADDSPQGDAPVVSLHHRSLVLDGMRGALAPGHTAAALAKVTEALNRSPEAIRGDRYRFFGLGKTGTPARALQTRDLMQISGEGYFREYLFSGDDPEVRRLLDNSGVFVGAVIRARLCGPPRRADEPCPQEVYLFSGDGDQKYAFDKGASVAVHLEGVGRSAVAVELARDLFQEGSPFWDYLVSE